MWITRMSRNTFAVLLLHLGIAAATTAEDCSSPVSPGRSVAMDHRQVDPFVTPTDTTESGRNSSHCKRSNEDQIGPSDWSLSLTPYIWMAGVRADLQRGNVTGSGEASFPDLLEQLDLAAMLHFEAARRNQWGIIVDVLFMELSNDATAHIGPVPLRGVDIDGQLEMAIGEVSVFYRALDSDIVLDLIGGLRYTAVDADVDVGFLSAVAGSRNWLDPIVGLRVGGRISDDWDFAVHGDIGGFKTGSDLTWSVRGHLAYHLSESTDVLIGYQHLDIDYERSDFDFDAQFSGPYLALSWRF